VKYDKSLPCPVNENTIQSYLMKMCLYSTYLDLLECMCTLYTLIISLLHSNWILHLDFEKNQECINSGMDYWTRIVEWTTGMVYF